MTDTTPSPAMEAAVEAATTGILERISWPSQHWGVENVHPDAWPHIARAATEAALAAVALDRDTIAKTLGTHRVERQAFAPSPEFYCHDCDENSQGTPEDHLADAVIAASPIRSVTEAQAEALDPLIEHLEDMADSLDEHVTREDVYRLLIEALGIARKARLRDGGRDDEPLYDPAADERDCAARIREGGQP